MFETVRKLGMIERACAARHDLGHYPCASIMARYTLAQASQRGEVLKHLVRAVKEVLLAQPIMCCGIVDEDTSQPAFVNLERIDVMSCITIESQAREYFHDQDVYMTILARRLESLHETCFTQLDHLPGWKLIVTMEKEENDVTQMDVLFAWHHSFFDGLSGVNFHKQLAQHLNNMVYAEPDREEGLVIVPQQLKIIPPVEKCMRFPVTWKYWLSQYCNRYLPNWIQALYSKSPEIHHWAGGKCQLSSKEAYRMGIKVAVFTSEEVDILLQKCRQQKVSLTGLMHGTMVTVLANKATGAESFLALTPLSLRNLTGHDKGMAMVNEFDDLWCIYDGAMLQTARQTGIGGVHDLSSVWDAGQTFKRTLNEHRRQIPWDLELAFPDWSDVRTLHLDQIGKDRFVTFEMSNIGSIDEFVVHDQSKQSKYAISNMVWTQSAMVTGPLLTIGAASVKNGPLSFTFSWQAGVCEDSFANSVVEDFQKILQDVIASS